MSSAQPARRSKKRVKNDENNAPRDPEKVHQDEIEAASASMLFAELMIGTPRGQAHVEKSREMLKRPLPETIQPPSIVVQHSEQGVLPVVSPSKKLIARYDYLSPAEMAQEMARADTQPHGAPAPGPQPFQVEASEDPEDEDGDDSEWIPEVIMARRRLRADAAGDGRPGEWQYLVRWQGRPESEDAWVPESALDPAFLASDMASLETERQLTARKREVMAQAAPR